MSCIRDINLAPSGEDKINWVKGNMPLLRDLEREFAAQRPFEGMKIALSVHMEAKTAYLCRVLEAGGAEMHVTGCNPLSTQDDVAAALCEGGIDVYAIHGATAEQYEGHLSSVLECGPSIVIDDGGDLVNLIHTKFRHLIPGIIGGCEETTTGITRLEAMTRRGHLEFPMIAVNNARCKYLFDNRYGTGQSVWDGINRTTNLIVAGKVVVIAGYGWCGRGVAMRAKGFGARVIITEIDPVKAIEAIMDGFEVMTMERAACVGDLFITVTGCCDVITGKHFAKMKNGAILCNAGHFDVEVDVEALERLSEDRGVKRPNIMGYRMTDGRWIHVLAEGRLVNLASGDGHPAEIMDMSFSIQALSAKYLVEHRAELKPSLIAVPDEIDMEVAARKLRYMGANIEVLTDKQEEYLAGWGN
jgi:adenosylhomocysteinase